jgi:phosphate-selective porin
MLRWLADRFLFLSPLLAGCALVSIPSASAAEPHGRFPAISFASTPVSVAPPADEPAQKAPKKGAKSWLTFVWEDHPSLRGGKKQLRLDFKARVTADALHSDAPFASGDNGQDTAKKRMGVEGDLFNIVDFQIERELSGSDPWRDVFVEYHQYPFIRAMWGKFKLPFSLEETTGASNLDFAYRSNAATQLAPGRDRGWMIHGQVLDHAVGYEFGKFDHDGKNASPSTNNPDRVTGGDTVAWRLTTEPFRKFKSPLADFEAGLSHTGSDLLEGFSTLNGKTALGSTFFGSNQIVNGRRERKGFEMRWRPGPASVKWEYIRLTEERLGEGVEDNDVSPREAVGWYISGTFALTGEKKSKGLDMPLHPLMQGGFGAVEVAVRVEKLAWGSVAKGAGSTSPRTDIIPANSDTAFTIGANWYPNKWVKIQVNLIKETLTDPSHGPLPAKASFWSRIIRFQIGV